MIHVLWIKTMVIWEKLKYDGKKSYGTIQKNMELWYTTQGKLTRINSHEIRVNFMRILRMKKRRKTSIRISQEENAWYSCAFYTISCDFYTIIMWNYFYMIFVRKMIFINSPFIMWLSHDFRINFTRFQWSSRYWIIFSEKSSYSSKSENLLGRTEECCTIENVPIPYIIINVILSPDQL